MLCRSRRARPLLFPLHPPPIQAHSLNPLALQQRRRQMRTKTPGTTLCTMSAHRHLAPPTPSRANPRLRQDLPGTQIHTQSHLARAPFMLLGMQASTVRTIRNLRTRTKSSQHTTKSTKARFDCRRKLAGYAGVLPDSNALFFNALWFCCESKSTPNFCQMAVGKEPFQINPSNEGRRLHECVKQAHEGLLSIAAMGFA